MEIAFEVFAKDPVRLSSEFEEVRSIALQLRDYMALESVCSAIQECHRINGTSQQVQAVLNSELSHLGFESERNGLFRDYAVASLRPDFYRPVGKSGILLEVERGKTLTNNMDLLDLWKCHLCAHADFLFLIVPNERPSKSGQIIRAFEGASRRLSTFFQPRNYTNVEGVFIFGY